LFSKWSVKKNHGDNWCQNHLADQQLSLLLEKVDADLAEAVRLKGCEICAGKLESGNYPRKPRGGPQWDERHSFCCANRECRKRHTPASVRFLGRKVYVGIVMVLLSAMLHGLKPKRVSHVLEHFDVDRRTLGHWRQWWLDTFVKSQFWQEAKARFMPPVDPLQMPWSLVQRFGIGQRGVLLELMRFLLPLTIPRAWPRQGA
jgi:hypothetical protein